jgi:hypothetical protein
MRQTFVKTRLKKLERVFLWYVHWWKTLFKKSICAAKSAAKFPLSFEEERTLRGVILTQQITYSAFPDLKK